jgi:hypothetical protein
MKMGKSWDRWHQKEYYTRWIPPTKVGKEGYEEETELSDLDILKSPHNLHVDRILEAMSRTLVELVAAVERLEEIEENKCRRGCCD